MNRHLHTKYLGACLALATACGVQATTMEIASPSFGNYINSGLSGSLITVGWNGLGTTAHQFSVFDLSGVSESVIGADLVTTLSAAGFVSADETETLTVFDVATDPADLGTVNDPSIYTDLGNMTDSADSPYGSQIIPRPTTSVDVVIQIDNALLDLNTARVGSGLFSLGLASTDLNLGFFASELVFFSQQSAPRLVLEVADPVPAPAPVALLFLGLPWLLLTGSRICRTAADSDSR